jgi:hypothetical protein
MDPVRRHGRTANSEVCDVCPCGDTCNGIEHNIHGETSTTLNEFYGTIDSVRRGRGRKTRGEPVSFAVSFWVDIETATQGMIGGSGCPLLGRH